MDQQSKGVWPNNPGWGEAGRNNEIVLDTRSIEEHLPRVVLAFFFRPEMTNAGLGADENAVRRHRAAFLKAFDLPSSAAPLVRCDVRAPTDIFTLVD